jgi:serine phosphatase RsbU (regulator of sigma subunit)
VAGSRQRISLCHGGAEDGRGAEVAELDGRLADLVPEADRTVMQRMVIAHDWAATGLGAEEHWSPTLRATVGICLNSQFPMVLFWGPELVQVYNDAYVPLLATRHPRALGAPAPEVWSDVWPAVAGLVADVFAGRATYDEDLPLTMTRRGYEEETYFTFSYSPVMEPGGAVAGLLNTVVETTPRVLATRRLGVLQELGRLPRAAHLSASEACAAALEVLGGALADCPFALVHLSAEDGSADGLRLVARHGASPAGLPESALLEHVREVVRTGEERIATGLGQSLPELSRAGELGRGPVDVAVVLPLTPAGRSRPVGTVVLGVSPRLDLDDEYRTFLALVAGQVATAVTDAQAVERERRRAAERAEVEVERARFYAEVAVTLQRSILGPTVLPAGFAVHYAPATGTLEVGGDWYDVVDLPDGLYGVVVGDVVGRGLPAAAVMGQLRSAARALLLESRSPGQVLSALDRFAELVPGATCSTLFCAVVDPVRRLLRYSNAGHLPALLVRPEGVPELLEGGRGLPLAVVDTLGRPDAEVTLPAGSTLLLYTDGLVEHRGEDLDEGIGRAAAVLSDGRTLDAADLAALLTDRLLTDARDDDVAFLVYRTTG